METRELIIIRGPSGSGKSTLARKLQKSDAWICEADDYFVGRNGEYKFDPSKLGAAHANCQERVQTRMLAGDEQIIVSNTSMRIQEVKPYLALALQYGYAVKVYRTQGPWDVNLFASRNVHNVPQAVVQRQIARYQPLENEEEYV